MELLKIVVKALDDAKASGVKVLDMRGMSPLFDYMVIATAGSSRQSNALVEHVKEDALKAGFDIRGIEGENGSWVLVDCKDIIVNIFSEEERQHYGLDNLFIDVKQMDVEELLK